MPQSYDEVVLAELLLNIASEMPRARWYTTLCRDFESMLDRRATEASAVEAELKELEGSIESAWESYYESPIAPEERTAETMVGHRLLVEGLAGWMEAIKLCRTGAPREEAWAAAERANRLLVVVQYQARRLRGIVARRPK